MSSDANKSAHESSLPGSLGWIDSLISRFESFALSAGVMLMAFGTCVNVVSRFGFGYSFFFLAELNKAIIILITFAGIGYAARHGRHIRMSAIYDSLPFMGRKILMIVMSIITAVAMFMLCYFSVLYILDVRDSGRVLSSTRIEVWWIYIWVPLGFAVTGIQYALTAVKNIVEKDVYLSTSLLEGYEDTELEV